ncbi:hypothetical protein Dda_6929 [Drechslerella dactyloides]|uniref:RRM domain-containing protein n=1 Tax=Drechslerella dactyloides TaxID=74499 RepID=A0AAD6ITC6_DREDA|nr:hypothetical protein Dda_6929 [Drechslerella dactyloides]
MLRPNNQWQGSVPRQLINSGSRQHKGSPASSGYGTGRSSSNPGYSHLTSTSSLTSRSSQSTLHPVLPRGPPRKPKQSGHALWVGNLPAGTTVSALKDYFAADQIESVFLILKSNCAFVNYKTEVACNEAMSKFHDSCFQGVRLVCRLPRTSSTRDASETECTIESLAQSAPTQESSESLVVNLESKAVSETESQAKLQDSVYLSRQGKERYFIFKSLTLEDLDVSVSTGIWATQTHNEPALNEAYSSAENVFLIFSANKSGEYYGYAHMASAISDEVASKIEWAPMTQNIDQVALPKAIYTPPTATAPRGRIIDDSSRGTIFWEVMEDSDLEDDSPPVEGITINKSWGRPFRVEWVSTFKVPFYRTRGLRNPYNLSREVKIARDGTEIEPSVGMKLLQMAERQQEEIKNGARISSKQVVDPSDAQRYPPPKPSGQEENDPGDLQTFEGFDQWVSSFKPEPQKLGINELQDTPVAHDILENVGYEVLEFAKSIQADDTWDGATACPDEYQIPVVQGPSCYDPDLGLLINQHEPLDYFLGKLRQVRVNCDSGELVAKSYPASLEIDFNRTLRLPERNTVHNQPSSLGVIPINNAAQDIFAVRVFVGGVNAVSGLTWKNIPKKQDYLLVPPQSRLDGVAVGDGVVKQFVAMPLGAGYSVEKQVTGQEAIGGLQLEITSGSMWHVRCKGSESQPAYGTDTPNKLNAEFMEFTLAKSDVEGAVTLDEERLEERPVYMKHLYLHQTHDSTYLRFGKQPFHSPGYVPWVSGSHVQMVAVYKLMLTIVWTERGEHRTTKVEWYPWWELSDCELERSKAGFKIDGRDLRDYNLFLEKGLGVERLLVSKHRYHLQKQGVRDGDEIYVRQRSPYPAYQQPNYHENIAIKNNYYSPYSQGLRLGVAEHGAPVYAQQESFQSPPDMQPLTSQQWQVPEATPEKTRPSIATAIAEFAPSAIAGLSPWHRRRRTRAPAAQYYEPLSNRIPQAPPMEMDIPGNMSWGATTYNTSVESPAPPAQNAYPKTGAGVLASSVTSPTSSTTVDMGSLYSAPATSIAPASPAHNSYGPSPLDSRLNPPPAGSPAATRTVSVLIPGVPFIPSQIR